MFNSLCKVKVFSIVILFGVLVLVTLQFIHATETFRWLENSLVVRSSTANATILPERVLAKCPLIPRDLMRHVDIDQDKLNSTESQNVVTVKPGGRYKPLTCESRYRVAVIIPYRDRENHLKIFLRHMHPFLQRQHLDYGIYVVEPTSEAKFNRALLLNIGFVEANKLYNYDCVILHDVDLLPENDGIPYTCEQSPLHLSVAIDTKKYKLPYQTYFGGVCAFKTEHFKKINGFSNIYFDWGGEDDDMYERVKYSNLKVIRLSVELGRYKMLQHGPAKVNTDKMLLFKTMKARHQSDGLNSLRYHVVKQEFKPLYTRILVRVNETDIMESETVHKRAFIQKV